MIWIGMKSKIKSTHEPYWYFGMPHNLANQTTFIRRQHSTTCHLSSWLASQIPVTVNENFTDSYLNFDNCDNFCFYLLLQQFWLLAFEWKTAKIRLNFLFYLFFGNNTPKGIKNLLIKFFKFIIYLFLFFYFYYFFPLLWIFKFLFVILLIFKYLIVLFFICNFYTF